MRSNSGLASCRLVVGIFCAVLAWLTVFDIRPPLEDVHWDSPIWLHQGKAYAETHYILDLQQCAKTFSTTRDLPGAAKVPICFPEFSRLGHVVILGALSRLLDSGVDAVVAATWSYRFMLAVNLGALAWLILNLQSVLNGGKDGKGGEGIGLGLAVSTFLFAASTLFQYLGSSLVSDVPSMLLVTLACLAFVRGLSLRSSWRVGLSGLLAFLAYVVRLESVIIYLLFLLALAVTLVAYRHRPVWWPGFVVAGVVALICYIGYLVYLFPLPSPFLYLANAGQVQEQYQGTQYPYGFVFFMKAGGLLWIGVLLQAVLGRRCALSVLCMAWLALLVVPFVPWFFQQGPTQTRHYVFIVLPLMALSALGWSAFIRRTWLRPRLRPRMLSILTATACLGIISHANAFSLTSHLPGMWRLSQLLGLPAIEKVTFPLDEAVQVSRYIYRDGAPTLVLLARNIQKEQDYVFLLAYLGPPYGPDTDAVKYKESGPFIGDLTDCSRLLPLPVAESAQYFSGELTAQCAGTLRSAGVRVLRLSSATKPLDVQRQPGELVVLNLRHFALSQLP